MEVLTRKEMYDDGKGKRTSPEVKYRVWLREIYETTFKRFVSILEEGKSVSQLQAFDTMMKLLALEGKNPLEPIKYEGYHFPSQRLQVGLFTVYCSSYELILMLVVLDMIWLSCIIFLLCCVIVSLLRNHF